MTSNTSTYVPSPAPPVAPAAPKERSASGRWKHISKANVRKLALDICAHDIRHKNFRRIKPTFYDAIEAETRAAIARRVKQQPSVGKTLT